MTLSLVADMDVTQDHQNPVKPHRPNLGTLPPEILLLISRHLDAQDIYNCQRTCQQWRRAFGSPVLLKDTLIRRYHQAREVRNLVAMGAPDSVETWAATFERVHTRYAALKLGKYRSQRKINLDVRKGPHFTPTLFTNQCPVSHWEREFGVPFEYRSRRARREKRQPSEAREPFWSYDAGLLVHVDQGLSAYVVLHIESDTSATIPFDRSDRVVRRVRLKNNVVVFEWAESQPYHQLNPMEEVHRHFVTAFDVVPNFSNSPYEPRHLVKLRSEWKLHFLGFPLRSQDVWLSTHNTTHYAVYIWQNNRSAWGEDEPIESLLIWDIAEASNYRPSSDPSGALQPSDGPKMVRCLPYKLLDWMGIRQRDVPLIRGIGLDGPAVRVVEAQYSSEYGFHSGSHPLDRSFGTDWVRTTDIPIQGAGPPAVKIFPSVWTKHWCRSKMATLTKSREFDLDQVTFDLTFPGRGCEDEVAGLRFAACKRGSGVEIAVLHSDWQSSISLQFPNDYDEETKLFADERCVIVSCGYCIRIFEFDKLSTCKDNNQKE